MKKKNLKSLSLNKKAISNFTNVELSKGGIKRSDRLCSDGCPTNGTCLVSDCVACNLTGVCTDYFC